MSTNDEKNIDELVKYFHFLFRPGRNFVEAICITIEKLKEDKGFFEDIEDPFNEFLKKYEDVVNNTLQTNKTEEGIRTLIVFLFTELCKNYLTPSMEVEKIKIILESKLVKA